MRTLVKLTSVVAVAIFAAIQAHATVITNDTFSYANGDLNVVSGGIWSNFNGTTALNVTNGQAFVTGLNSKDDQLRFDGGPHSNDVLYAGFNVNAQTLATSVANGGGAYFALFKDDTTFNFTARVEATNFTSLGSVRFGIANQASVSTNAGVAYWASTTATGTLHRIVVRLDLSGAVLSSTLWLDPTLETDTSITATDLGVIVPSTNYNVQAYGLRQSNAQQGGVLVDELIIGTSFADVVPEPSTMLLVGGGLISLLAVRRRRS